MQNQEKIKAVKIGTVCIFSYLASYFMRKILSVSTPGMIETGLFTKEMIGFYSSTYFFVYAIGQLFNGRLGDRVKAGIMVPCGLFACGIASISFAFVINPFLRVCVFAIMGFSLSMLRGPLVKTISENTLPKYARICCVFFSVASFAGPFIASFFAMLFDWRMTFVVSGACCILIAACAYTVIGIMEKKGVITYSLHTKGKSEKKIRDLFKLKNFLFYAYVGALAEIAGASIGFWMPTYFTERLLFDKDVANLIFSIESLVGSCVPFLMLVVLKWFKDNDIKMAKYAFLMATVFFIAVLFVTNKYVNVLAFFVASTSVGFASSLLWSAYIPSQGKSGMVSTLNGVLDFSGYAAAAVANIAFSYVASKIDWNGVIVLWIALMASGVVVAAVTEYKRKTDKVEV